MCSGNPGIVACDGVLAVVPALIVSRLFCCPAYQHAVGDNHVLAQVAGGLDKSENDADPAYFALERIAFSRPVTEHGAKCLHSLHLFSGQGHPADIWTPRPVIGLAATCHARAFYSDPRNLFAVLGRKHEDVLPSLDGADDVPGRQNAVLAIGSSDKTFRSRLGSAAPPPRNRSRSCIGVRDRPGSVAQSRDSTGHLGRCRSLQGGPKLRASRRSRLQVLWPWCVPLRLVRGHIGCCTSNGSPRSTDGGEGYAVIAVQGIQRSSGGIGDVERAATRPARSGGCGAPKPRPGESKRPGYCSGSDATNTP